MPGACPGSITVSETCCIACGRVMVAGPDEYGVLAGGAETIRVDAAGPTRVEPGWNEDPLVDAVTLAWRPRACEAYQLPLDA